MKILTLLLLPFLAAPAWCASPDCSKSSEACSETGRVRSPFLAAAARDAAAEKAAAKKQASVKPAAVAVPAATAAPAAAPAAPVTPVAPAASPLAQPGWSLLAVGLIAGLYFYLRENSGKRKK